VVPPQRSGGQAQFVHRPIAADERGRLTQVMDWVRAHPRLPHDLDSLAGRAAMSVRTLQRQFKEATGFAPQAWLIHERVTLAKAALEETALPLARIADQAGFTSLESFRRHFRQLVGTSPSAYRASFGRPRGAAL
jgi:AraC family transcriptional activator FtrA